MRFNCFQERFPWHKDHQRMEDLNGLEPNSSQQQDKSATIQVLHHHLRVVVCCFKRLAEKNRTDDSDNLKIKEKARSSRVPTYRHICQSTIECPAAKTTYGFEQLIVTLETVPKHAETSAPTVQHSFSHSENCRGQASSKRQR